MTDLQDPPLLTAGIVIAGEVVGGGDGHYDIHNPARPAEIVGQAPAASAAPAGNSAPAAAPQAPPQSPAGRRLAAEEGVDVRQVNATGRHGVVLKEDVQAYVKTTLAQPAGVGRASCSPVPARRAARRPATRARPGRRTSLAG